MQLAVPFLETHEPAVGLRIGAEQVRARLAHELDQVLVGHGASLNVDSAR